MKAPWVFAAVLLLSGWAIAGETRGASRSDPSTRPVVFELREASAFAEPGYRFDVTRGQLARCTTRPSTAVKRYPTLQSRRPLYGSVKFGGDHTDPNSGVEYHFVVDGRGDRYNQLYFDRNRDLDLTNDPPIALMKNPPDSPPQYRAQQTATFDYLEIPFDFGPEVGMRPFRVVPRLIVQDDVYAGMMFVSPTVHKGTIRIGERAYEATLAQAYVITGRFDLPFTNLQLRSLTPRPTTGPSADELWDAWGMDRLGAVHQVDGRYYVMTATPTGDKLIVHPYTGEFGIFAIGAGGRDIKELSVFGSLASRSGTFAFGGPTFRGGKLSAQYRVPVGDYYPLSLNIQFGRLRIFLSNNYHGDGSPRERTQATVYGIKIRKDRPFVLDFANKPSVLFASPAKDAVFSPGDEVKMAAVLVDPELDFMIRNLDDTTRKQTQKITLGDGRETSYDRPLSLDPIVRITDSNGKEVFTGKMPFG